MLITEVRSSNGQLEALHISQINTLAKTKFITESAAELQVGVIVKEAGDVIPPHRHLPQDRSITRTCEVLYVLEGQLTAQILDKDMSLLRSLSLSSGDTLILFGGSHGFSTTDGCRLLEVKQGPYHNGKDKEPLQ